MAWRGPFGSSFELDIPLWLAKERNQLNKLHWLGNEQFACTQQVGAPLRLAHCSPGHWALVAREKVQLASG